MAKRDPSEFRLPIPGRPRIKDASPDQMREAVRYYRTAEKYGTPERQQLLDLFADAHGRPPGTLSELLEWGASPEGEVALAEHIDRRAK